MPLSKLASFIDVPESDLISSLLSFKVCFEEISNNFETLQFYVSFLF